MGVSRGDAAGKTHDSGIANDYRFRIAIPGVEADVSRTLSRADKGFSPVPALDPKSPSTSFRIRGVQLRVDLLTPMIGRTNARPIALKSLHGYATPVRFLDYLLEDTQPAALIGGDGVLVDVPTPTRFALHKLVVSRRRPVAMEAKRRKDLNQSAHVLTVLPDGRPGDIEMALAAAMKTMPETFLQQLRDGAASIVDDRVRTQLDTMIQQVESENIRGGPASQSRSRQNRFALMGLGAPDRQGARKANYPAI